MTHFEPLAATADLALAPPALAASTSVSDYDRWHAESYYGFYYRDGIVRDERITLDYHLRFLRAQRGSAERALDYGCGPTLHNAIAVAPYVGALDMADWSADNLACVRRWVRREPGAGRWRGKRGCGGTGARAGKGGHGRRHPGRESSAKGRLPRHRHQCAGAPFRTEQNAAIDPAAPVLQSGAGTAPRSGVRWTS